MRKVETFFKKNNIDYDLYFDARTGVYLVITSGIEPYYNIKGVKIRHYNPWAGSVQYVSYEDDETIESYNRALFALSNLFYKVRAEEKNAGKTDAAAVQAAIKSQYEYATKHDCINVFNNIYQ